MFKQNGGKTARNNKNYYEQLKKKLFSISQHEKNEIPRKNNRDSLNVWLAIGPTFNKWIFFASNFRLVHIFYSN